MANYDYVIAKLHALNSKNYIGDRYDMLAKVNSIEQLHKDLFPNDTEPSLVKKLYTRVERLFREKIENEILNISRYFNYANEIINSIILNYEIDNVKILINSHLSGIKSLRDLTTFKTKKPLDYNFLATADISDFKNIQKILKKTLYGFLLSSIEQKKDILIIENMLDKFYYGNILNNLRQASNEERIGLHKIINEEMNWQNILWAFRTKVYYEKKFDDIKETFIEYPGLISINKLQRIFDMQFIPNEANKIFNDFPKNYQDQVLKCFNENGDANLPLLEDRINQKLVGMYIKNFYISRNILAIISYIFIKKYEYNNIIKIVESLRYKMPVSA